MKRLRRLLPVLFLLQTSLPTLPVYAAEAPVTNEQQAIDYVTSQGIMPLFLDGTFKAQQPVSRIEFLLVVLHDVYWQEDFDNCFSAISSHPGKMPQYTHLFADVEKDVSYGKQLCIGMFVGLVNGRSDGTFAPLKTITLSEAAKWATKAYGISPNPALNGKNVPWYEPYRQALAKHNAIPRSVKRHDQLLTRGDAAQIMYALRDVKPAQGFRFLNEGAKPQEIKLNENEKSPAGSVKIRFLTPEEVLERQRDRQPQGTRSYEPRERPSKRSIRGSSRVYDTSNSDSALAVEEKTTTASADPPGEGSKGVGNYHTRLFRR